MQIPTSAGMLANSVLPVTPTQGGLLPQVGETAGSASFAPVEKVTTIHLTRPAPEQRPQPSTAPENSGQADISSSRLNENNPADPSISEEQMKPDERSKRQESESKQQVQNQEQQQKQDLELVRSLSQRDSEVHAHENAHSAVGGQYAGSANYTYQQGPDGVSYAVGGEVPIDVGAIPGNPAATLEKMQLVQRAALAPADPSSQDRKIAALAAQQAGQARAELVSESRGSSSSDGETAAEKADKADAKEPSVSSAQDASQKTETESSPNSSNQNFQAANDRIAKINEILVAISQNDATRASGQLLDAVVQLNRLPYLSILKNTYKAVNRRLYFFYAIHLTRLTKLVRKRMFQTTV